MSIRKIEFDTPRDPGASQSYQAILNDMVTVKHFAFERLVIHRIDVPPELRQDHHFQVTIFEYSGLPYFVDAAVCQVILKGVRIDFTIPRRKVGIRIFLAKLIGWNRYRLDADSHGVFGLSLDDRLVVE